MFYFTFSEIQVSDGIFRSRHFVCERVSVLRFQCVRGLVKGSGIRVCLSEGFKVQVLEVYKLSFCMS